MKCNWLSSRNFDFVTTELSILWGKFPAVAERDVFKQVYWIGRVDFMGYPIAKYNLTDPVIWGPLEEEVYAAPPAIGIDFLSRFQAVVTAVEGKVSGIFERTPYDTQLSSLKWREALLKTDTNYKCPWFLHLTPL
jgi:hypothetical protein